MSRHWAAVSRVLFSNIGLPVLAVAFIGFASVAFFAPAIAAAANFEIPVRNGAAVDGCASWQAGCGQPAADQFCRQEGYAGASSFSWAYDLRTFNIGSNRYCDRAADNIRCGGLRSVVCTGSATQQQTNNNAGRTYPPGQTKTCYFTSGSLAGTTKDFYDIPGATFAQIGGGCLDGGTGSTGVGIDPYTGQTTASAASQGAGNNPFLPRDFDQAQSSRAAVSSSEQVASNANSGRTYPPGMTKTCYFTSGSLAGTTKDFYDLPGATFAQIGGGCMDGATGSTGVGLDPYQSSRPQSSVAGGSTFNNPQVNGATVDSCVTWGTNCGQMAADNFCRTQGYQAATSFQINYPGRTYVLGDNKVCDGPGCGGFSQVVCTASGGNSTQRATNTPPGRTYPPGMTKTCYFTTGSLAGTTKDFYDLAGATFAQIGGSCMDGATGSTGVALAPY